jgi:hypothetical protein
MPRTVNMYDVPLYQKFDGKKFLLQGRHERKEQAQVDARIQRQKGRLARTVRNRPGVWLVYVRGK